MRKKIATLLGAFLFIQVFTNIFVQAEELVTEEHWAKADIAYMIEHGIYKMEYLLEQPDKFITEKELNEILGDITQSEAVSGRNQPISRELAIAELAMSFGVRPLNNQGSFLDSAEISSRYLPWIEGMRAEGYIVGRGSGAFDPMSYITNGEIACVLRRMGSNLILESKQYTEDCTGSVIISQGDVILNRIRIDGDLILTKGIRGGTIHLDNVVVTGDVIICEDADVTLHTEGSNLEGEIRIVGMNASLCLAGTANIMLLEIWEEGVNANIELGENVIVKRLTSSAAGARVFGPGQIEIAFISGKNIFLNININTLTVDEEAERTLLMPGLTQEGIVQFIPQNLLDEVGIDKSEKETDKGDSDSGGSSKPTPPVEKPEKPTLKGIWVNGETLHLEEHLIYADTNQILEFRYETAEERCLATCQIGAGEPFPVVGNPFSITMGTVFPETIRLSFFLEGGNSTQYQIEVRQKEQQVSGELFFETFLSEDKSSMGLRCSWNMDEILGEAEEVKNIYLQFYAGINQDVLLGYAKLESNRGNHVESADIILAGQQKESLWSYVPQEINLALENKPTKATLYIETTAGWIQSNSKTFRENTISWDDILKQKEVDEAVSFEDIKSILEQNETMYVILTKDYSYFGDLIIPYNKRINIPEGITLSIENGKIKAETEGGLLVNGSLIGHGKFVGDTASFVQKGPNGTIDFVHEINKTALRYQSWETIVHENPPGDPKCCWVSFETTLPDSIGDLVSECDEIKIELLKEESDVTGEFIGIATQQNYNLKENEKMTLKGNFMLYGSPEFQDAWNYSGDWDKIDWDYYSNPIGIRITIETNAVTYTDLCTWEYFNLQFDETNTFVDSWNSYLLWYQEITESLSIPHIIEEAPPTEDMEELKVKTNIVNEDETFDIDEFEEESTKEDKLLEELEEEEKEEISKEVDNLINEDIEDAAQKENQAKMDERDESPNCEEESSINDTIKGQNEKDEKPSDKMEADMSTIDDINIEIE